MSMSNGQLPPGWAMAALSKICAVNMGQSPPSSSYNLSGDGLPFFQGKAEFGALYPETRKWCSAPSKTAEGDDVLLSVRAPVGPTNLAPCHCCIGRGLAALTPSEGITHRYIMYALRTFKDRLERQGTGTTFKAVSGAVVRGFGIPIAPTNEQRRIVEKIEELFSDLDAGVAALERVKANLKRYRASVLKAAVEGRLTEQWRKDHPDTEPADQLLARILTERRKRWITDQLDKWHAKQEAKGIDKAKITKAESAQRKKIEAKYAEPVQPDTAELSDLPSGWCWATCRMLLSSFSSGSTVVPQDAPTSLPILRSSAVRPGLVKLDDVRFVPETRASDIHDVLDELDVLFTRLSGSIDYVAVCATVRGLEKSRIAFPDRIFRGKVALPESGDYLAVCFESPMVRHEIEKTAKSSAGHQRVSTGDILDQILPLAPLAELREIVAEIRKRISNIDTAEELVDRQLHRATRLRQSILKRAFEGKLVPQDPSDEPAEKLLARIKTEGDTREKTRARSKPNPTHRSSRVNQPWQFSKENL